MEIVNNFFTEIADAIRFAENSSNLIPANQFVNRIGNLKGEYNYTFDPNRVRSLNIYLTDIADAIKYSTNDNNKININDFAEKIKSLKSVYPYELIIPSGFLMSRFSSLTSSDVYITAKSGTTTITSNKIKPTEDLPQKPSTSSINNEYEIMPTLLAVGHYINWYDNSLEGYEKGSYVYEFKLTFPGPGTYTLECNFATGTPYQYTLVLGETPPKDKILSCYIYTQA